MGVDLIGRGGHSLNWTTWRDCFALAEAFGWTPQGTSAPIEHCGDWRGSYFTNELQFVTDDDARSWGLALHHALEAVEAGQSLTVQQQEALSNLGCSLVSIREFADYALARGFAIS